jgi:serine/threonine protein kinase
MPSIGERLAGRYRLDAVIGSGGFATVFRAHDLRLERDVAVKVLRASHATDPVIAARFDREARALAAMSHPNVVAVHDVDPGDPATAAEPFLVMDLCGGSLSDRLTASESGALRPDELVPVIIDVAAGLEALHARGIVHRDLKPSNVLLCDARAQIADLGIATAGPSELTTVGTTIGTLAYLAPEQLAGESASPASDVHALAVIAFLGLTGRLPRSASSVSELVASLDRPVEMVCVLEVGRRVPASQLPLEATGMLGCRRDHATWPGERRLGVRPAVPVP